MPNFCPTCGEKLQSPNPNFCPHCGAQLIAQERIMKSSLETDIQVSIRDLGEKLEECVEKILTAKGYEIRRRERIQGKSGALHEIDVIAKKGNIVRAVECKNWKDRVGKEQIQKFWATLQDLSQKWNGVFVSFAGFTEDAEDFADYYNIERWDPDYLKEELFAVSVGRAEYAILGETITVKNALPLKTDFLQVTRIDLYNKEKISATGVLSYHPYFVAGYSYYAKFKDPTKQTHTFKDVGKVFIDGLDGTVLNQCPAKGISTITKALKLAVSKEAREENRRNKKLIEELQGSTQVREYDVKGGENYKVRLLEPTIGLRSIEKSAVEYIIKKNTETVYYTPRKREEELIAVPNSVTHVPKRKDINIKGASLVYVPRWDLTFEAINKTYSREVLGCSGATLEDTIRNCPRHTGLMKKENIAICDACGQALCEKHVFGCPVCGKWLCEEDGTWCKNCERIFCNEHILLKCEICDLPLCDDCRVTCPICGESYGRRHTMTCDICGKEVCPECVARSGFLRKKTICKECKISQVSE